MLYTLMNKHTPVVELNIDEDTGAILKVVQVGAVRNMDTLTWLGAAPVFDSGTSLWHDQVSMVIHPNVDVPSHPFKPAHAEQIVLAGSLDWIDYSALRDIDEEFRILLSASPYIDEPRTDKLCNGLKGRVRQLEQLALEQKHY